MCVGCWSGQEPPFKYGSNRYSHQGKQVHQLPSCSAQMTMVALSMLLPHHSYTRAHIHTTCLLNKQYIAFVNTSVPMYDLFEFTIHVPSIQKVPAPVAPGRAAAMTPSRIPGQLSTLQVASNLQLPIQHHQAYLTLIGQDLWQLRSCHHSQAAPGRCLRFVGPSLAMLGVDGGAA